MTDPHAPSFGGNDDETWLVWLDNWDRDRNGDVYVDAVVGDRYATVECLKVAR